jgi:hypothetical protein
MIANKETSDMLMHPKIFMKTSAQKFSSSIKKLIPDSPQRIPDTMRVEEAQNL